MSGFNSFPQYNVGMQQLQMPTMQNQNYFQDGKMERYINLTQQQNQSNMSFIIVESKEQAKNYIVQNGQTLWFRHSSKPEIYVKSVSSIGEPNFGAYELNPIVEKTEVVESNTEFASKEDVNGLNQKVEQLQGTVDYYCSILNNVIGQKNIQQTTDEREIKKGGRPKSTQPEKVGE